MVNTYVLSMEENTFLVLNIIKQIEKQRVKVIMTKFNNDFIEKVKDHWEKNKDTINGKKIVGIHKEFTKDKKFTMNDLAEYFNITFAQAKRIVYVKKGKKNDS
tara:strand:+ start:1629 stop:1937 length:309 start_codon:yes stop_codon:yes gene_type:complete